MPTFRRSVNWSRIFLAALVGAVAFMMYWSNVGDYFLADDFGLIGSFYDQPPSYFLNLLVNDQSNWIWDPEHAAPMLRPMQIWFLKIDYELWGVREASGFHITASAFFAAVAVLVFLIADQLSPTRLDLSLFAGLVTAIHPVFSYIVPWISSREETLVAGLGLSALLCFLRHRKGDGGDKGFPIFFALALLTKESGAFFLVFPLLYDSLETAFSSNRGAEIKVRVRAYFSIALVITCYAVLRWVAFGSSLGIAESGANYMDFSRLAVFLIAIAKFAVHPGMLALPPWVHVATLAVAASALFAIFLWRNRRVLDRTYWVNLLFAGPGWYIASAVCLYGIGFDARHNALPVIGGILFVTTLLGGVTETAGVKWRIFSSVLAFVVAFAVLHPPAVAMSEKWTAASRDVRDIRAEIEAATAHLPDESVIRLKRGIPQFEVPPYYFGWSLLSSLKKPFSSSDLASRMVFVSAEERKINARSDTRPKCCDLVFKSDRKVVSPPSEWNLLWLITQKWVAKNLGLGVLSEQP